MRRSLLKKQPTWGLRRAQGTGQKSATPETLTRILLVLLTMLLLPSAAWGQITVAGNSPNQSGNITGTGITGTVTYSNGTLTLTGAEITGDIVWNPSENTDLTINLSGNNTLTGTISTDENISSTVETNLSFTGSTDCSLEITKESEIVISGNFKTVNFGNFNLATSSPGAYWDENMMRDYSGYAVSNLKITSEVYYPIWVMHKQGTPEHTQLTSEVTQVNLVRVIDDTDVVICTVSYDTTNGKLTIEANEDAGDNAFQPGSSTAAIVVGPSMEELKVHLKGKTKITDSDSFVFSIWDTTSLIFTTDETSPGNLTGTKIVNWKSKNMGGTGQISCENGLVYNAETNPQTISTTGVRLKIGDKEVSVPEDITIDGVSFDNTTNTLTLTNATIGSATSGSNIQVYVDDLKVVISGENTILGDITYSGNSGQSSSIQINKATDEATLTLSGIDSFGACIWGEGLYLTAFGQGTTNAIDPHYEYSNGEGHFCDYSGSSVSNVIFSTTVSYPLWVGGVQVTDDNKDGITGITYTDGQGSYTSISGTVSFNPTGNILKLTNVTLSSPLSDCGAPIISNLPNLEIDVNGRCNLSGYKGGFISDGTGGIKSVNADATLVISTNYTTSSGTDSPTMQIDTYDPIASGFKSISTDNQMIYKRTSNYYLVQRIAQPTISLVNGSLLLSDKNEIDLSYTQNSAVTLKYKITDAAGTAGEEKIFDSNTNEPIENPCTIDAWAVYQSQESELVTGKYFGIADKTIVFNNETKGSELKIDDLEIIPATKDEGVSFTFRGVDKSDVINPSLEGSGYKLSITGIGRCEVDMEISVANPTIQVLNPFEDSVSEVKYAKGVVTVIPDKPTIMKKEKEYLDTDKITITRTSVEGEVADNIKIFYTWDAEEEVGSDYFHTDSPILSIYDSTDKIPAQTGTLRAWAGYGLGDNEYIMSESESQEFTVKTDISNYTIQGLEASTTYTGAAINPTFTVVDQKETELASTNYTVSYQKVETTTDGEGADPTEKLTDVDEMVEVGSYKIVVTGTGDYGGSKSVGFEITKADLDIVTIEAIADQTYTGSAITLEEVTVKLNDKQVSSDEYEITGYSNNTNVSTETEKATVTITATASSIHFTQSTTQTATFNIVAKALTAEMIEFSGVDLRVEDNSFIYNGLNQKPTVTVTDPDRGENGTVLEESTDYDIENEGGTNVGEYTVTITGKGNYSGSASKTFSITAKAIATEDITVTLSTESDLTYDGTEKKPAVTKVQIPGNDAPVELTTNDYDADNIVYENNINAGENTATATVTLKGNYSGTGVATFSIEQADLQYAAISKIAFGGKEYTVGDLIEIPYTGEAIQPTVEEVTFNDGTVTVDASDYNVSYSNNTEISSDDNLALIIITSTGKNFTEGTSTSQGFKIVRATVTITAENQTVTYNADKQEYDISKIEVSNNNAKLAITYYAKEADRSNGENALAEAPTNADTYYVRVTLNEESQQHYVADPADATFTIDQLEMTNSNTTITLDNTELTYNGEAQTVNVTKVMVGEIEVPAECYEVSDNTATEAGTYTAKVTAKSTNADGSDFKNNFKGSATIDWKINHRTASAAELGFTSETQTASTYYNPDEAFNLPEGYVGYIVTGTNGTNVLTTRVSYIQKGVAVLVEKGSSSANAIDEAPDPANLPLKGTSEPLEVSSIAGGTVYVLYNGEFVKSTSGTIPAKRCYLLIESSVAAGTRAFGINHNIDANGIDSALFDDNNVKADDKWFDLQGRRIEKPTKAGIYVVNGKKVMINNK